MVPAQLAEDFKEEELDPAVVEFAKVEQQLRALVAQVSSIYVQLPPLYAAAAERLVQDDVILHRRKKV